MGWKAVAFCEIEKFPSAVLAHHYPDTPIHHALAASIAAYNSGHLVFLATQHGDPYTARGFGNWFTDAAKASGLPAGRTAHGLRKAAARRLAEAGCTTHQIAAITGHQTLKEVERYTRAVAQKTLAASAMDKVNPVKAGLPSGRLDNSPA